MSGSISAVVRIAPRNSHEPCSRETRLVCLPCQPRPAAAASGFSRSGAVSTNILTSAPLIPANCSARVRIFFFQDVVIVAPFCVNGYGGARVVFKRDKWIVFRRVALADHDDGPHIRPQRDRIGALISLIGEPLHVSVAAFGQKRLKPACGLRNGGWLGDGDAIEAKFDSR